MSNELAFTGRVLLENRQPPPEPVPVSLTCRGSSGGEWTDEKGRFALVCGKVFAVSGRPNSGLPGFGGCRVEVRAAGFETVSIDVSNVRNLSGLDLKDILLKPKSGSAGAIFSGTGYKAPGAARREYLRALEEAGGKSFDKAIERLGKAERLYPSYASAYFLHGLLLERMGRREDARAAYEQAAEADPAYVKPLVRLAEMAGEDQDPEQALLWASRVNRLVPGVYPEMYLMEGGAYYNLDRFEDADRTARAGLAADPDHTAPRLHKLLGETLYRRGDFAGALQQLRAYIEYAGDAPDIEPVKERAALCERLSRVFQKK